MHIESIPVTKTVHYVVFDDGYKHEVRDLIDLLEEISDVYITDIELGNRLIALNVIKTLGNSFTFVEKGSEFDNFYWEIQELSRKTAQSI